MVVVIFILSIVAFVVGDLLVRLSLDRKEQQRQRDLREKALDAGLRLDFADEAKTLKRVQVPNPKATILAVDDEDVVLESFRRILVLDGYSIDTVNHGPEALTLVKQHAYDFVFTDLKMPDMDGVDVVKAVKHLRPDIDVVVITGFATVETAVETMKYGALEYVQKPFTPQELTEHMQKLLVRRQERDLRRLRPTLTVGRREPGAPDARTIQVLPGVFTANNHTWATTLPDGRVRVGLDDFVQRLGGPYDAIEGLQAGQTVSKGDRLCTVRKGGFRVDVRSPVSGRILSLHHQILSDPKLAALQPYETAYLCTIEATNLASDLATLKLGANATQWYQQEVDRYVKELSGTGEITSERFMSLFLDGEA